MKKFNRINDKGTYHCQLCGKLTRDTGNGEADVGEGYCKKCLFECYMENAESDYGIDSPEYAQAKKAYDDC